MGLGAFKWYWQRQTVDFGHERGQIFLRHLRQSRYGRERQADHALLNLGDGTGYIRDA